MAILRKVLAKEDYTKIDNFVARNKDIPDYAFRLYVFIAGFRDGFQMNDGYIAAALDWSQPKVTRAKRELKHADLICVEKIDRSTYFLYIGTSKVTASKVKRIWHSNENDPER